MPEAFFPNHAMRMTELIETTKPVFHKFFSFINQSSKKLLTFENFKSNLLANGAVQTFEGQNSCKLV